MTDETPQAELVLEPEKPKVRQILIETDGTKIHVAKFEVNALEARTIFEMLLEKLRT